jgi:hypothetical protein
MSGRKAMVKSNLLRALGPGAIVVLSASLAFAGGHGKGGGSVCDESDLVGSAYAACHVYCESLDCDSVHPNGSATACDRSLDRFMELTGELPPCEPVCPCGSAWRDPQFSLEMVSGGMCAEETDELTGNTSVVLMADDENAGAILFAGTQIEIFVDSFAADRTFSCASEQFPNPAESSLTGEFRISNTYRDESERSAALRLALYNSCRTEILALAERLGIDCESPDTD